MSDPSQLVSDQSVGRVRSSPAVSVTVPKLQTDAISSSKALRVLRLIAPLMFAAPLFALNNLSIISGWLAPPHGYAPMLIPRAQDTAVYLGWASAYLHQSLSPNYAAPWLTEAVFFNPMIWLVARTSAWLGVQITTAYLLLHLILYVVAAYSLVFAARTFTESRRQMAASFVVAVCVVPFASLLVLPAYLLKLPFHHLGAGHFVWLTSDGFFHGISGSILVTFGTAMMLIVFSLLAKYLKTSDKRYFVCGLVTTCVLATVHPTEAFLIMSAGSIAFMIHRGWKWRPATAEILLLCIAGGCGLAPYAITALRTPWMQEAAAQSRWGQPGAPHEVILALGLPALLTLTLLVVRPKMRSSGDFLLQSWFACTLVEIFIPLIPVQQHLFDGFHYATAFLLVRQSVQSDYLRGMFRRWQRPLLSAGLVLFVLSIYAYGSYYVQSFRDGRSPQPERLFSTVASRDEIATIDWLKQNATTEQLVLAPPANAPWMLAIPMHSFASHWLWSLNYEEQLQVARRFYDGELSMDSVDKLIRDYGIRYLIIPQDSRAMSYMGRYEKRASLGAFVIFESREPTMKPFVRAKHEPVGP